MDKTRTPHSSVRTSQQSQTLKARQANAKISQQLQERAEENRRVSGQLVQLFASVKVREAIYRSHTEASGGEVNPAQQVFRQARKRDFLNSIFADTE